MIRIGSRDRNKTKKQESKKASALRSWKPRLEALEDRTVPAYIFSLVGSTATVTPLVAATDSLVIDASGGFLEHSENGGAFSFDWDSILPGDQTLAANAASTVNVHINTGDGSTLTLGTAAHAASSIFAHIAVSAPVNTADTITINDTAGATASPTYTIDTGNAPFSVTGPGINFTEPSGIVNGGITLRASGVFPTRVNVVSTFAGEPIFVDARGGIVVVGDNPGTPAASTVSSIRSPVNVSSSAGPAGLFIRDAGDTNSAAAVITATAVSGLGFGAGGLVNYTAGFPNGVATLDVQGGTSSGGTGGVTYNISSAAALNNFFTGGSGNDTFNVSPINPAVFIFSIDGGAPTTFPGDRLNYLGAGSITPTGPGSGFITQPGFATITFSNIELATTNIFSVISTPNGLVITFTW